MDQSNGNIVRLATNSYRSITFITTYQCTAACRECCFESSPTLKSDRLDSDTMIRVIREAMETLPNLQLVVFSGGECFMLKDELFKTIAFATQNGLATRCVSNGYWGKTPAAAKRTVDKLVAAGIGEINLSTGLEHQEWVPQQSILNCAEALVDAGVFTLVTVEKDTDTSECWQNIARHSAFRRLRQKAELFRLASNAWMPFHTDAEQRGSGSSVNKLDCDQLFNNLVITPYKKISACCGLTFEHIPDLHMGQFGEVSVQAAIADIATDFLKIWLHIDGPAEIVRKVGSAEDIAKIDQTVHICQACAVLHQSSSIKKAVREKYVEFVPAVIAKFVFNKTLKSLAQELQPLPNVKEALS